MYAKESIKTSKITGYMHSGCKLYNNAYVLHIWILVCNLICEMYEAYVQIIFDSEWPIFQPVFEAILEPRLPYTTLVSQEMNTSEHVLFLLHSFLTSSLWSPLTGHMNMYIFLISRICTHNYICKQGKDLLY